MAHPYIEKTGDGSDTLRHPATGETYHSSRGAVTESMHVFISRGLACAASTALASACASAPRLSVVEMGFGSGLNAWLTLDYARANGIGIDYMGVELHPIPAETARRLNYTRDPLFMAMHEAPWETETEIAPGFRLLKTEADFAALEFNRKFDVAYFDAFAPDTQPELWTEEIFSRLHKAINPGGILVTYSAKGSVKRALGSAGFEAERLPGAPGKRHMLRAVKRMLRNT